MLGSGMGVSGEVLASPPVLIGGLVAWEDVFTTAELDAIERHGDALAFQKAGLSSAGATHDGIRVTQVAWFGRNARTEIFYHRMEEITLRLNQRFFHYDLSGLVDFQYAIYRGSEGGRFDWHKDYGREPGTDQEPRKLTISIQISDASAYEGCELQVRAGNEVSVAPKKRGTVVAFPAYALHCVTPITAGVRKSLVLWAAGPEFR
jgi:PKHD-type hydroxylase